MTSTGADTVLCIESGTITFEEKSDVVGFIRGRGLRLAVLGRTLGAGSALAADVPLLLRELDDPASPLEAALAGRVAAVLALDDAAVRLAAEVADHPRFGPVAGAALEPFRSAAGCTYKRRLREALSARSDLAVPFRHVTTPDDAARAAAEVGLPCIVKPAVGANSQYVYYAESVEMAELAARAVLEGPGAGPGALVEAYQEGPEFSVEAFTVGGRTTVVGVCRKLLGPLPYFVEVGHAIERTPSPADEAVARAAVEAIGHLGLDRVVTHTEVRLTTEGARVIEINPRPAGGRMRELVRTVTGYDLVEASLAVALGEQPPRREASAETGLYDCITVEAPGVFTFHTGFIRRPLPSGVLPMVEVDVPSGTNVFPVNDARGRVLGRILTYGRSLQEARNEAERIRGELLLAVTPLDPAVETPAGNGVCACGADDADPVLAAVVHGDTAVDEKKRVMLPLASGAWKQGCC